MEVKTVDETGVSLRSVAAYLGITAAFVVAGLSPLLVDVGFSRVLNTLFVVALLGLVGRTYLSTLLAFTQPDPPELPDDADLPSVSVVIPAYNEATVLDETIEACKRLDYPDGLLEVVLCYEAASTDGTGEICERAAAEDDRFVAVERDEPGGGKAPAVNYALAHATGDVIASIDADHQFAPDAVKRAVAWFRDDEDVWCVKGRCYGKNPEDSIIALHATVERHIAEKADLFARDVAGGFTIFGGGQAFFRREVFDLLGEFDEEVLVEDIDMSSKLHEAGKEIRVDPGIVTYEENPATLSAWWSQRKRWARGWMQVAVRHTPRITGDDDVPLRTKFDAVWTFVYAVVPALLVLMYPLSVIELHPAVPATSLIPNDWLLWGLFAAAPPVTAFLIFLQDRRDGFSHHPREYLAAFTLWFYLVFQTAVFVVAFIDEFVLGARSVYVTTTRSEAE